MNTTTLSFRKPRRYALDRWGNILRDPKTRKPLFEDEVKSQPPAKPKPDNTRFEKLLNRRVDEKTLRWENRMLSGSSHSPTPRKRDPYLEQLRDAGILTDDDLRRMGALPREAKAKIKPQPKPLIALKEGDSILKLLHTYSFLDNLYNKLEKSAKLCGLYLNMQTGKVEKAC